MKYLLIILLLTSCSARWHVRQAEKHLRKAEFKGAQVKYDTVFVSDTIVTQKVTVDTLVKVVDGDTAVIQKDKLTIRYIRLPGDTFRIQGECAPDTIIREIPVTITKEIIVPKPWRKTYWIWVGIIALTIYLVSIPYMFFRK